MEELATELYTQLVNSAFTDGIKSKASFIELLSQTALINPAKVFQYLQAQFFAKAVPFLLNLEDLLSILSIVFEVNEEFIRRFDQMRSLFVAFFYASVSELLDSFQEHN